MPRAAKQRRQFPFSGPFAPLRPIAVERPERMICTMADRQRDNAICLYVTDFSETSQVAHFLTRAGGVAHLLAKGTKRAKSMTGGAIDLLAEGDLVYIPGRGDAMGTLVEFAEQTNHSAMRRRLASLSAGLYMLEVTHLLLAEADPHERVFDLLSAALRRLDDAEAPVQAVLAFFQWRLLRHVGLLGRMDACVSCGRVAESRGLHFSSSEGGLLCRNCEAARTEKLAVSPQAMAGVRALLATDGPIGHGPRPPLGEAQASAVNELLAYHISYQRGRPLRTLRYVRPNR